MIMAPLWGERAQGPCPYNWGPSRLPLPCTDCGAECRQVSALLCSVSGQESGEPALSRRGAQSCVVSTLGRTAAPRRVLSCPVQALAGRWKGRMCWGVYLSGTRAGSSLQILCPEVPDNEGKREGVTVESLPIPVWLEPRASHYCIKVSTDLGPN